MVSELAAAADSPVRLFRNLHFGNLPGQSVGEIQSE